MQGYRPICESAGPTCVDASWNGRARHSDGRQFPSVAPDDCHSAVSHPRMHGAVIYERACRFERHGIGLTKHQLPRIPQARIRGRGVGDAILLLVDPDNSRSGRDGNVERLELEARDHHCDSKGCTRRAWHNNGSGVRRALGRRVAWHRGVCRRCTWYARRCVRRRAARGRRGRWRRGINGACRRGN